MHNEILTFNKIAYGNKGISEKVDLSTAILYGGISKNDPKFAGLYVSLGKVDKRLKELSEERKNKIDAIFEEEYNKIKKESDEYIAYLESRKGEMVAYVPSTSRVSCLLYTSAVVASMIIAEMATTFENNGSSIYNEIIKIYEKYGWRLETTVPITKKGKDGLEEIQKIMKSMRAKTHTEIAGVKVKEYRDYQKGVDNCLLYTSIGSIYQSCN